MRVSAIGVFLMMAASLAGCARIDKQYLGRYQDVNNPRNSVEIFNNGVCPVVAQGSIRKFKCSIAGNTVSMTLIDGTDDQKQSFEYPEFRGATATLTIEGSTLITQKGTRFGWVKNPGQGYE